MIKMQTIKQRKPKRVARIRARIHGTETRPRMIITKSHTALTVQFVNDENHKTMTALRMKGKNMNASKDLVKLSVDTLKAKKITTVVFDRNGYKYHGVVKAFVEGVREGGIIV